MRIGFGSRPPSGVFSLLSLGFFFELTVIFNVQIATHNYRRLELRYTGHSVLHLAHGGSDLATGRASVVLLCDRQEELELRWQLLLRIESVREINSSDSAVRVNLDTNRLNVVGTVGTTGEVGKIELDLVPALI